MKLFTMQVFGVLPVDILMLKTVSPPVILTALVESGAEIWD